MSHIITNGQTEVQLSQDVLEVGSDVYWLDDVLYADVADTGGQQVTGLIRHTDRKMWLYIGLLTLMVILPAIMYFVLKAGGVGFFIVYWFLGRGLIGNLKQARLARAASPVIVRVHTRTGSIEALRTPYLFHAWWLALKINRGVKRNMLN